jgi:streptogramin lyase
MKTFFPALCLSSLATAVMAISGCGSSTVATTPTTPIVPVSPVVPEVNNCKGTSTTSPAQPTPTSNYAGSAFTGTVKAGTSPLIGASVQLYAAGSAGNGSAGTALLATALTTNASGGFSVPAYTCPLSNSVLYAIATGGSTTVNGVSNTAAKLASVVGVCSSVSASTTVTVDEATTVATAFAMSPFLAAGGKIGASSTNGLGIALAAANAANLVNTATGVAPGAAFPATGTAPTAKIDSLANLLNGCVVNAASSLGCTQLESATAVAGVTPANTLDAMVNLAKQPGTNVASLYTLSAGPTAYAPSLLDVPADWTLYATYSGGGMNDPSAISIDSTGTIWVSNYFNAVSAFSNTGVPLSSAGYTDGSLNASYGGAVNVNDNFWVTNEEGGSTGLGTVTVFTKAGSQGSFNGGGMNFPLAAAFDTSGLGWIVDYGDSAVSLFSASKTSLAGTGGFQASNLVFPVGIATDADCNAYVANQSSDTVTRVAADGSSFTDFVVGNGPSGVAVDTSGNVWTANYYGNSVGLITAGTTVASGSGFTGGGVDHPQGIAPDGAGNVWVANYRGLGITELAGATASSPGAALSPTNGWAADAGLLEPFALAIDAAGSVWVSNFGSNTITQFVGVAAPVKTPLLGPVRVP